MTTDPPDRERTSFGQPGRRLSTIVVVLSAVAAVVYLAVILRDRHLSFTVAELLLSLVGLSVTTKLTPDRFRTQMVALFLLSVALGTALSGTLARYYGEDRESAYFGVLGAVAIVPGVALAALTPVIRRLTHGMR